GRLGGGSPPLLHRPLRHPRALPVHPARLALRPLAVRPRPPRRLDGLGLVARPSAGGDGGGINADSTGRDARSVTAPAGPSLPLPPLSRLTPARRERGGWKSKKS